MEVQYCRTAHTCSRRCPCWSPIEFAEVTSEREGVYETRVRPDGAFALYINHTTGDGFQVSERELTGRSRWRPEHASPVFGVPVATASPA